MKIKSLTISNVLGIDDIKIDAGKIVKISGKNSTGKSTILKSLNTVLSGGNLVHIKKIGADEDEKSEIKILIENGNEKILIKKNESSLRVKTDASGAYKDIRQPQNYLKTLFDGKLINPLHFVSSTDADRIGIMLETVGIQIDKDDLEKRCDVNAACFKTTSENEFKKLDEIRQNIYDERTGINRDAKEKKASVEQIRNSLLSMSKEDITKELKAKEKTKNEKLVKIESLKNNINLIYKNKILECESKTKQLFAEQTAIQSAALEKFDIENAEVEKQIRQLRDKQNKIENERTLYLQMIGEKNRDIEMEGFRSIEKIKNDERTASEKIKPLRESVSEVDSEIEILKSKFEQSLKQSALAEQADIYDIEYNRLEQKSESYSKALDTIQKYKTELLQEFPFENLEIKSNKIYLDGIIFENLNTGKQIEFAVKIACMRARQQALPIIWVDGLEALDSDNRDAMLTYIEHEDVQAFVANVTDSNLTVN